MSEPGVEAGAVGLALGVTRALGSGGGRAAPGGGVRGAAADADGAVAVDTSDEDEEADGAADAVTLAVGAGSDITSPDVALACPLAAPSSVGVRSTSE